MAPSSLTLLAAAVCALLLLGLVTPSHGKTPPLTLLGVIYGSETSFCDAFYYTLPRCSRSFCSIPLDVKVCSENGTNYGLPNPAPINVMHANWECGSIFYSADLAQGQGDRLVISCPDDGEPEDIPETVSDEMMLRRREASFKKHPVAISASQPAGTLFDLGVVIGSSGVYCDAYFKTAPMCQGFKTCTIPINNSMCTIGLPNPQERYNYMHIMYSCGYGFNRVSVKQSQKLATLVCP